MANIIPTKHRSVVLPMFVDVAVPVHLREKFTYKLPEVMRDQVQLGSRVVVPFGAKPVTAYVVGLLANLRDGTSLVEAKLKTVEALLDVEPPLTPEVLAITRWVADYYDAPWGEVMRAALPAGMNVTLEEIVSITEKGRAEILTAPKDSAKTRALRLLADEGEFDIKAFRLRLGVMRTPNWLREMERDGLIDRAHRARSSFTRAKRRKAVRLIDPQAAESRPTKAQQRVVETLLRNNREMTLADLISAAGVSESVIRTLVKKGAVSEFDEEVRRDPLARAWLPALDEFRLTSAQADALKSILESMKLGKFAAMLLHGVTGSGKTEVYIRAMHTALEQGRGAMMLVPEIALTPILSRRLRAHFGDQIAIFHSSLSKGERFDEWSRVRSGAARLVIGTRSAVFAPVENLGLIIIDEEHDMSYRQQESPFYHARDTAIVRAQKESAVVVLGSATPSLETFHNAQAGKYRYLHLAARIANRPMAHAEMIDMRDVFSRHKRPVALSDKLVHAIEQTHARGEQSIVLLNRRGYSSFILCRSCGESIMCPNCEVTLTYHRGDRILICHYCNHRQAAPSVCPICSSKFIYYVGEGTEQIEEMLRKRFPTLRIARIDRDTASRRHSFEQALLDFGKGKIDMLVGTQMIAKGHDFPNVTLVGVVSVDAGLALPDFRAGERTFQLITQVAGRAGRGDLAGRVLVQTYHPEHYALRHACAQDYPGFYNEEIRHRRNHGYPPFVALASLLVHHKDLRRAQAIAAALRQFLNEANSERACRILGPAPAPLSRLRNEHRIHLLIKSRNRKSLRRVVDMALAKAESQSLDMRSINLEIDPVSLM